jgi:hypothetical protein
MSRTSKELLITRFLQIGIIEENELHSIAWTYQITHKNKIGPTNDSYNDD